MPHKLGAWTNKRQQWCYSGIATCSRPALSATGQPSNAG
jgi:hypothetical protein